MTLPSSQSEAMRLGAPKYRTGRPCLHGHLSERWTSTANCYQCTVDRVNAKRARFKLTVEKLKVQRG